MKTVIVGCGRVGAVLADSFDQAGHEVIVIDPSTRAFDRLPSTFGGDGHSAATELTRTPCAAPAPRAPTSSSRLTEGDNRNVLAAQVAPETLGIKRVVAKINDPVRAEAYADLGIATLCRTMMMATRSTRTSAMPVSGRTGVLAPTGSHPGGEDHHAPVQRRGPLDRLAPSARRRRPERCSSSSSAAARSATT